MKIQVALVTRDQAAAIVSENPIGKHAVITDEEKETSEVLPTDTAEIEAILYSRTEGVFQIQFALGGFDKAAVFHRNLKFPPAMISLVRSRENDAKFWTAHDLDNLQRLDFDELKTWIHAADGIDVTAQAVWNLPTLESKLLDDKGEVVSDYKKGSTKAVAPLAPPPIPR